MNQLSLFGNITCVHCGNNTDPSVRNNNLWDGFIDNDTGEHCCNWCKKVHYWKKAKKLNLITGMIYSETPVVLKTLN